MSFLADILIGVLSLYLALTHGLAAIITDFLPSNSHLIGTESEEISALTKLPSHFNTIPQILIENAAYQGAAVTESSREWTATTDGPLAALVNILCTFSTDTYVRTTTGTGFFIHRDGVILTNAHVAQFLLLEQANEAGEANCNARTGNPATPQYELSLLYLPPTWVQEHAALIDEREPSGTGERDYALLYVSRGLNDQPMPRTFPALAPQLTPLTLDDRESTLRLAGYPAGGFRTEGPNIDLIPVLAETTMSELYTFTDNQADVIAVRGSAIGEQGSSGGPILNSNNEVIGLISTRGDDSTDGQGSLRGISIDYINRTIHEETGFTLHRNVSGDLPFRAKVYNDTLAPFLTTLLAREFSR